MLILAVDTSTKIGSLAVLRGEELLGEISSSAAEPYSSRLFADLDKLLGGLGLSLKDFDLFAVAAGPGSFTGLRVGLTAVKAWAEVYGRPIVPISGLHAVAAQISASDEGTILVPVTDARRGQVFGAIYERQRGEKANAASFLKLTDGEVVMAAEEFLGLVAARSNGGAPLFASPSPEVIEPALPQSAFSGSRVERVSGALASIIGRLGYEAALRGETIDALHLAANYVRRTDAESHWKEA
jgi:tRNA threonylcarbamoyladenosine biosynthesis protein TsaB